MRFSSCQHYQMTFSPSWICRDVVEVWFRAVGKVLPSESKTELFCPNVFRKPGDKKFV